MFKLNKKAQVALEALVIFGVLAIGTIIFGLFFVNNIREAFTSAPGAKQDRNTGGDVYDNIEGSLIYNEEQQIGSSSFGIIGGGGNTGSGGDDIDPPTSPFCGDGRCDLSETPITCPQDCSAGYYNNLILTLIPPTFSQQDQDFNIKVSLNTDQSNMIIKKLIIKDEFGINTENCQYDGDYRSIFENLGTLEESETPELYTLTKQFSCNSQGSYTFNFTISPQDNLMSEITSSIEKEIRESLSFISTWDTTKAGESASNQILLPLINNGTYDFNVDWGDGTTSTITTWNQAETTHTYATPGIYTITITGTIKGFKFFVTPTNRKDAKKILEISQWGPLRLGVGGFNFAGAENLIITAQDILDLNGTTSFAGLFNGCSSLTEVPSINDWNTSQITSLNAMFSHTNFNQPLSFDTSNVVDTTYMFNSAESFNQPLDFNTSKVTNMFGMFYGARAFNQPLVFDTSQVTNMQQMFTQAKNFNQPLDFNTSKVTNMHGMFTQAKNFNQPLSFDTTNVTNMQYLFFYAEHFNQPLDFNTSKVTNMYGMFMFATDFNQPLDFDTSKVTVMPWMFYNANAFNQDISDWNVSNVTNMDSMFRDATSFNQPLNDWNVSNVTSWVGIFTNCPINEKYKPNFR